MNCCLVAAFALQSWFLAKVIQAFQFTGQQLMASAHFWALMFFILAMAVAVSYFIIGYGSNSISVVRKVFRFMKEASSNVYA
jgi:ATP-binding cassette, subfamily B (MDR/TAP), member 1